MRQPYRSLLDPITFYGAFGLLLFGPVAFGATEPWSIFLLEAGSALLFLMWIIRQAQAGEVMVSSSPLFAPMLSFMALVGLQLLGGHTAYRYQTLRSAQNHGSNRRGSDGQHHLSFRITRRHGRFRRRNGGPG